PAAGHPVAAAEPLAQPAVHGDLVGRGQWLGSHVEPGVAAQGVDAALPAAGVDDETRAPERGRGPHAAEPRDWLRYVGVNLDTEMIAEEVADSTAGTELVGQA